MDLADFVKARLDEDEDYVRTMFDVVKRQEAKAAEMSDSELAKLMPAVMGLLAAEPAIPAISAQWAARGTRPPNDLNRVLADIAAKRAILAEHAPEKAPVHGATPGRPPFKCLRCHGDDDPWASGYCRTILLLAVPFATHPDYQEGWKP
jgi:hypothetical protein